MLQLMQRLLHSSDDFDSKLRCLGTYMQALQALDLATMYPYRATAQAKHLVMSFCVRSLCSAQSSMKGEETSELWHTMAQMAAMDSQVQKPSPITEVRVLVGTMSSSASRCIALQVSHSLSIPFSVLDAAAKSLALATTQANASYLADCNRALNALKPLLCKCPASQAIKLCGAAVDSLVQLCHIQQGRPSTALVKEVILLVTVALDLLGSAQGSHSSRSWQLLTETLLPSAIAAMWDLPCLPELREASSRVSAAIRSSLQRVLAHPDLLLAVAKEFELQSRVKSDESEAPTAVAKTNPPPKHKQQKEQQQQHANGVLGVWQLVQRVASGVALSTQETHSLRNIHHFCAWLIRTYHICSESVVESSATQSSFEARRDQQGIADRSAEAVSSLPWHVLGVVLQRGMDALKQTDNTPRVQQSICVALAACAEALRAAEECRVRFPHVGRKPFLCFYILAGGSRSY